jgi:hypothetical protein
MAFPRTTKKRIQLGIIVSAKTKKMIERRARATGRTQAVVSEQLIERGLLLDGTLALMMLKLDAIAGAVQAREREAAA